MTSIRPPAVAGTFYPDDANLLKDQVSRFLAEADGGDRVETPRAIISPHAGYTFSGPVAGSAFAGLERAEETIKRVAIFGPSHHIPLRGMALSRHAGFETPLGTVALDEAVITEIDHPPEIRFLESAHVNEHSVEVLLPFVQVQVPAAKIVPILVGDTSPGEVADLMEFFWRDPATMIAVSSDLSHFLDYETAKEADAATCRKIESLQWDAIDPNDACGSHSIAGLLLLAKRRNLRVRTLDIRNSGDTAGSRDRVVGYGAWSIG